MLSSPEKLTKLEFVSVYKKKDSDVPQMMREWTVKKIRKYSLHSLMECKFWCYYNILMFTKMYIKCLVFFLMRAGKWGKMDTVLFVI